MPELRREIRTLQLRQPRYFDEHYWPTNVGLVLMAACAAGLVVHYGDFREPRPWANATVQLMAVGSALALALWGVNRPGPTRARRARFCTVMSLLVHTMLGVVLAHQHLRFFTDVPEPAKIASIEPTDDQQPEEPLVVPAPNSGSEQPEIDKPLDVGSPNAASQQIAQARAASEQPHDAEAHEAQATDASARQLMPERRVQQAEAQRAERTGERSSRTVEQPAQLTTQAVAAPPVPTPPAASEPTPTPQLEPRELNRRPTAQVPLQQPTRESDVQQPQPLQLARRDPVPLQSLPEQPEHRRRNRPMPAQPAESAAESTAISAAVESPDVLEPMRVTTAMPRSQPVAPLLSAVPIEATITAAAATATRPLPRQSRTDTLAQLSATNTRERERRVTALAASAAASPESTRLPTQARERPESTASSPITAAQLARSPTTTERATAFDAPAAATATSRQAVSQPRMSRRGSTQQPSVAVDSQRESNSRRRRGVAQRAPAGTERVRDLPVTVATAAAAGGGVPAGATVQAAEVRSSVSRSSAGAAMASVAAGNSPTDNQDTVSPGGANLPARRAPLAGGSASPTAAASSNRQRPRQRSAAATVQQSAPSLAASPAAGSATAPDVAAPSNPAGGNAGGKQAPVAGRLVAPQSGGLPRAGTPAVVDIEARSGVGGLAHEPARLVGVPDRRAANRNEVAHTAPARKLQKRSGGRPAVAGQGSLPAAAFARRGMRRDENPPGGLGQPSAKTEAAIELGLEFLARLQLSDGRWDFQQMGEVADFAVGEEPSIEADAAATGLALLAFLGAGYDHFEDKYQVVVERGIEYLVRKQQPSGELFPEGTPTSGGVTRFYSHGIAALALCEAYGMTGDPDLRAPAQRALDFIAETQHPERGGWRYVPYVNADLSVTGWQLMALKSGDLAGLHVSDETYGGVRDMVEACREQGANNSRFRYNPWASATNPRTRHGRNPSTVMTSVGLLAQLYLGSNRDNLFVKMGAQHLLDNLPEQGSSPRTASTGTLGNPLRDTYYWYYATQVMFHMGGEYWTAWNDRLHPLLVESQTQAGPLAGSWNPYTPVPDKWARFGGRLYVTTLNLLSLEVYYRHLPLYEMTAQ